MPALKDKENQDLSQWLIAQNQDDPWAGKSPMAPQPPMPVQPVPVDAGKADDTNGENNQDDRIKDSAPGHTPDDLTRYIRGEEKQVDQYGPEQEKALMDSIQASHGSVGNRIARGAAGLGDAIMGVAGKQGPGFLNSLESREAGNDRLQLESLRSEGATNRENLGAKERLEGMTSSTPLGSSMTAPLAAFFKRMGVPESEIPTLLQNPSAARSVIEPFATVMSKDEQIKMETMLKQLELAQRGDQIKSTNENERQQRENEGKKMQLDAAEKRSKLGPIDKLILHRSENAKLKELEGIGSGESEGSGPYGPTTTRGGKLYEWSPETKKYHLKQ